MIQVIDTLLHNNRGRYLTDIERSVLELCLQGQTYPEISVRVERSQEQVKRIGARLWRQLSEILGETVQKKNIKGALQRYMNS